MANQIMLCHPSGQMSTLNRTRTSILRRNELVEIQGSYWPRLLILSESAEPRKKSSSKKSGCKKASTTSSAKVSRRIKKKMELIRQLKKFTPVLSSSSVVQRPISPSFEASPKSLSTSISAFDQNTSPCWKPCTTQESSKIKTSSFTGRPVLPQLENTNTTTKPVGGPSSSGLKGPCRRKSFKVVVAPR
jgi:hypothetical protein